jgi:WXG100 family type VII secretion target
MADIVYRFPEMETAASEIDGYADQYRSAAQTLVDSITSATASWEGDSKDKFRSFLEGAVYEHIHENIPQIVSVIAAEIRASSENMSRTDTNLAENIPQSLG